MQNVYVFIELDFWLSSSRQNCMVGYVNSTQWKSHTLILRAATILNYMNQSDMMCTVATVLEEKVDIVVYSVKFYHRLCHGNGNIIVWTILYISHTCSVLLLFSVNYGESLWSTFELQYHRVQLPSPKPDSCLGPQLASCLRTRHWDYNLVQEEAYMLGEYSSPEGTCSVLYWRNREYDYPEPACSVLYR